MNKLEFRVLLIEDDPMVQEVNRQLVERVEGFKVVGIAGNGDEGLSLLHQLKPDLVLLDVYMPQRDGLETIRLFRQEKHDVDVIVITAASDSNIIRQMLQNGAIDYIIKPFQFDRVRQALYNFKLLRTKLQNEQTLSQMEVDDLLRVVENDNNHASELLPKGIQEVTMQQILLFLMDERKPVSSEEVAECIGLARVTVRRYLDCLEKMGKVRLNIEYRRIGRPLNRYELIQNK